VPAPASPVVAAWELALRLRQRRDEVGVEVKTITQALNFTRNYWSAVENKRTLLSEENLIKLMALLEFDQEERAELLELRAVAKERGWWTRYSALLDNEVQRLIGLESGAKSIRDYESLLMPGLLQTADYARAIMTAGVNIPQVAVDQQVEVRLRRQRRLTDNDPLSLTTIISEAALRQQIGGPVVLHGQLEYLANMIEQHPKTIEVRIIPFTATGCGLFGGATINLIEFENPVLPPVVWQETVTAWGIIEDQIQVRNIRTAYEDALRRTLGRENALGMIRHYLKESA
jgi:hypothetical protein